MTDALQRLMRDATRLTQAGRLTEATQALQRGLGHAWPATLDGGLADQLGQALRQTFGAAAASAAAAGSSATDSTVIDGCVTELPTAPAGPAPASPASTNPASTSPPAAQQRPAPPGSAPARPNGLGLFSSGSHHHGGLTRAYKLYSPPQAQPPGSGPALPLLVMLHGCTQDPDDFAAGTGMNALARELGFWVLYPAQSADANPQRCWNWFKHNHQQRGRGEAGLIASLTQTLVAQHGMDPGRVWIAGLSAGGAMAATVAAAYPELYAAVGVHSGLAAGAATDLPQALAAMRGGAAGALPAGAVPTIVFHGDQDGTVTSDWIFSSADGLSVPVSVPAYSTVVVAFPKK